MRPAFFALLFVNLAFWAWAHWIDAARPAPVNDAIAHLPPLKLVDELPPAERPQPHAAQKTSLGASTACLSVGPFGDLAGSVQAAGLLKAKGFEPHQRVEQGQVSESYWVYVGGLSQAEADSALVALERSGIGDALLTPDGGTSKRRLSLGLYGERARAERRAAAVRQSGLKAEIAARRLPATLYWVDLNLPPGVSSVPLQDINPQGANSHLLTQPCPPAAAASPSAAGSTPPAASPAVPVPQPAGGAPPRT